MLIFHKIWPAKGHGNFCLWQQKRGEGEREGELTKNEKYTIIRVTLMLCGYGGIGRRAGFRFRCL